MTGWGLDRQDRPEPEPHWSAEPQCLFFDPGSQSPLGSHGSNVSPEPVPGIPVSRTPHQEAFPHTFLFLWVGKLRKSSENVAHFLGSAHVPHLSCPVGTWVWSTSHLAAGRPSLFLLSVFFSAHLANLWRVLNYSSFLHDVVTTPPIDPSTFFPSETGSLRTTTLLSLKLFKLKLGPWVESSRRSASVITDHRLHACCCGHRTGILEHPCRPHRWGDCTQEIRWILTLFSRHPLMMPHPDM